MPQDYLGPSAAIDLVASVGGIDTETIVRFQQRANMSPQEAINTAAAAVGAANATLLQQYGAIAYLTDDVQAQYRTNAGSGKTARTPEFTEADAIRGKLSGHMLPEYDHLDKLGWSSKFFREASRALMDANIQEVVDNWFNRVTYDILTRMFSPEELAIGSGYSVGWAIGSGASASFSPSMTINVPYTPPQYQNTEFLDTHVHYLAQNSSSSKTYGTLLDAMIGELRHHGLDGTPFALVSDDDLDSYIALSKFVEITPQDLQIIQGGSAEIRTIMGNLTGVPGTLFGYYKSKRGLIPLRSHSKVPSKYAWMGISYGSNNPRNSVAIRVAPGVPWGLTPVPQMDNSQQRRLAGINFEATHGVGVNSRINGVAGYLDAGATAYVTPTIS
jgi:opacity protein-like surface antigen